MDQASFDSQSLGRRLNELLVLSLLRRAPMHGYQLAVEVEERSDGFFTFNHGTLYPILHRLEGEGLIAGEWSNPDEGRARKAYALTEAGRTYRAEGLREWKTLLGRVSPFFDDEAANDKVSDGAA